MAGKNSNTTDKLVIDIKVNVKKGATTQITNLTKSLTKLNEVVKNTANIEKYANALRTIGKELTRATSNKGIAKVQTGESLLETTNVDVNKSKKQTKETQKQEQLVKNITKEKQKQVSLDKKSNKEEEKSSSFSVKFARSIGRIALYRAIRTSLSSVVKMLQAGIDNLRMASQEFDKPFKQIESSVVTLQNSIASLFASLIPTIQPIVTLLSDSIGNIANKFNEAQSALNGSSTYMKVLTSDTKEWQEQVEKATGNLLEFDKFLSLNDNNGYTGFLETQVSMPIDEASAIKDKFDEMADILYSVFDILVSIGRIIKSSWVFLKPIVKFAVKDLEKNLQDLYQMIDSIAKILNGDWSNGIVQFLDGLVEASWLLRAISEYCKTIQDALSDLFSGEGNKFLIKSIKASLKLYFDPFGTGWMGFADGGMVEKGTRFIAGEAGAEVVHTSARGTGVTNIEQFSQAMLQALSTYGVARGSDVSFKGDVYIDRTKAGQLLEGSVYGEGVRVGHFKRV